MSKYVLFSGKFYSGVTGYYLVSNKSGEMLFEDPFASLSEAKSLEMSTSESNFFEDFSVVIKRGSIYHSPSHPDDNVFVFRDYPSAFLTCWFLNQYSIADEYKMYEGNVNAVLSIHSKLFDIPDFGFKYPVLIEVIATLPVRRNVPSSGIKIILNNIRNNFGYKCEKLLDYDSVLPTLFATDHIPNQGDLLRLEDTLWDTMHIFQAALQYGNPFGSNMLLAVNQAKDYFLSEMGGQ